MKSGTVITAVLAMAALSTLAACATQKSAVPEWVLHPPNDSGMVYGIGYAKITTDDETTLSLDALRFWDELSSRAAEERAYVNAIFNLYTGENGAVPDFLTDNVQIDAEDFKWKLDNFFRIRTVMVTWSVAYMEVVKLEKSPDGTWWCLAAYNVKKMADDGPRRSEAAQRRLEELFEAAAQQ